MDIPTLKAEPRKAAGSRAAARLRRAGKLPAVIYGHKQDPEPVTLDYHDVNLQIRQGAHLISLDMGGKSQPCLFKDAQYDHLGAIIMHIDLARVDLNERVKVHVPIEFRGTPKGVADGGVLRQEMGELEVECLVTSIPEHIRVNVTQLGMDEVLYVKDIQFGPGITPISDPESVVATVREPLVHVEPVVAEPVEGASDEPEVIAKVREEKEEGAEEKE